MVAFPDYQALMLPLLRRAANGVAPIRVLTTQVADDLGLTPEQRAMTTASGAKTLLADRVGWAKTYMKQAGLLSQPKRGLVEVTPAGLQLLATRPSAIDNTVLSQYPAFLEFQKRKSAGGPAKASGVVDIADTPESAETPDHRILSAAAELDAVLTGELLDRLKAAPASFFEAVVVDVLKKLGYGAGSGGMAEITGGAGDGGIDGVIDEDRLGLDRIYVHQAKRFGDASVGAPVIHGFIGALHMRGAMKGVLLTTSSFTKSAIEAAQKNPTMRIVLIDGERLAELMIRHGVGVRTDRVVEIKKIDLDYFEPDDA